MKPHQVLIAILSSFFLSHAIAQAQEMDKELSDLAGRLAKPIKENGRKKVTVLDFTDLQGHQSELGRYIAEQLTVELVMAKPEFSVLDRANLNKILAEHKLTASGLVDPDNAKKLGMFSGLDALILGTFTPSGGNIQLTAKIITTDTAEIVGAAKAKFVSSREVEILMTNAVQSNMPVFGDSSKPSAETVAKGLQVDKNLQQLGDLLIKVESLKPSAAAPGFGSQSTFVANLILANLNSSNALSIALTRDIVPSKLTNKRGDEFQTGGYAGWLTGLSQMQNLGSRWDGEPTEIQPKSSIKATIKYYTGGAQLNAYPPYRLMLPIIAGNVVDGRFLNVKKLTFMIDVDDAK